MTNQGPNKIKSFKQDIKCFQAEITGPRAERFVALFAQYSHEPSSLGRATYADINLIAKNIDEYLNKAEELGTTVAFSPQTKQSILFLKVLKDKSQTKLDSYGREEENNQEKDEDTTIFEMEFEPQKHLSKSASLK